MKINKKTLDNGLTQIVIPMADTPTATVLVMVNAGTRFENKGNNGVSHFLEHMCFKGTEKRPKPRDMSTELDALGAESNAFTWYEYTGYYGKAKADKAQQILDIWADVYKNSLFKPEEIKKEAGVITEEIRMYQDLPMQHVPYVFRNLIFGDQPAGWEVLGPEKIVQSLDRGAIVDYRQQHYVPEATTVIVVGGVDGDAIANEITRQFGDISSCDKKTIKEVSYADSDQYVAHEKKNSDQMHVVVGAPAVAYDHEDVPAIEVLSTILGRGMSSRLFHTLRDQMGVCYYINSGVEYYSDTGMFKISSGVDTSRVTEVVEEIVREVDELRDDLVEPAELEKAKEYLMGNFILQHESTDRIANYYAEQSTIGVQIETIDDYMKRIQQVTRDDVHRVANELLSAGSLKMAAVGPDIDVDELSAILAED